MIPAKILGGSVGLDGTDDIVHSQPIPV